VSNSLSQAPTTRCPVRIAGSVLAADRSGTSTELLIYPDGILIARAARLQPQVRRAALVANGRLSRDDILATEPDSYFVPRAAIESILLGRRWSAVRLVIAVAGRSKPYRFTWKREDNRYEQVRMLVRAAFGDVASCS
jgi:hypothetical protein